MLDVLVEAALRATLIAAAAALILRLLRVRTAAVCHGVWTVVLVAMLLLPLWAAWMPEIALRVLPAADSSGASAGPPAFAVDASAGESVNATMPARAATAQADEPRAATDGKAAPAAAWNWRGIVLGGYLALAGALLVRLGIGTLRAHALARDAHRINGYLTSARIATPFTVGVLQPSILLPEGWEHWPTQRLAAVLEHERAHVRRRDPLVHWLALLNRAVFWFHPLAWWLERRLGALAEEACDAAVLARGHAPDAYSEQLLELARMARARHVPHSACTPMPGRSLPARIRKILEGGAVQPRSRIAVLGATTITMTAAAAIGAITLAQEAAPPLLPAADSFTPLPEHWLSDDEWRLEVGPLMTPEEVQVYRALRSFEERDRFIGAFWQRRDPTPGTLHNERRKEHERRVHYADQWFRHPASLGTFGYQTTRGVVYVLLGEPDSIESAVEDGAEHEYWHYADANGTGQHFTIRLALSSRIGCGPAYEIVEPEPVRVFRGASSLGPGPLEVRVYPLGLVTFVVPIEYGAVERISATLEREPGRSPVRSLFGFDFRLAPQPLPAGKRGITVAGQAGLNCTVPIPEGDYRLAAEAELFSSRRLTDSVAFAVRAP